MLDSDFNSLDVVVGRAGALSLPLTHKGGSPWLFLFADTFDPITGAVIPNVNSQQEDSKGNPLIFFKKKRTAGNNRITYYRRTERTGAELEGLEYPKSTSQDALGYVRVHDTLECDPFGVYGEICSTSLASQNVSGSVGSVDILDNTAPEGARHAAYDPDFVPVVPSSADQCGC